MKIRPRDFIAPIIWFLSVFFIITVLCTYEDGKDFQHVGDPDCSICHLEEE